MIKECWAPKLLLLAPQRGKCQAVLRKHCAGKGHQRRRLDRTQTLLCRTSNPHRDFIAICCSRTTDRTLAAKRLSGHTVTSHLTCVETTSKSTKTGSFSGRSCERWLDERMDNKNCVRAPTMTPSLEMFASVGFPGVASTNVVSTGVVFFRRRCPRIDFMNQFCSVHQMVSTHVCCISLGMSQTSVNTSWCAPPKN